MQNCLQLRSMIRVVGGLGVKWELRNSGALGPASPEASEMKRAAPPTPESMK